MRSVLPLALLFLLAACSPPPSTGACLALRPYLPIQVDQADTAPTKRAVLRANVAHQETCTPPATAPWTTEVRTR
jgi:hypothetical protein